MKKIEHRAVLCLVLAGLLLAGLALFLFRFFSDGGHWASSPFNRHLYNSAGQLISGTLLDRDGEVLSAVDQSVLVEILSCYSLYPMGRPAASPSFTW